VLDEQGTAPFRTLARGDVQGLFLIDAKEAPEVKTAFDQVNRWDAEGINQEGIHLGGPLPGRQYHAGRRLTAASRSSWARRTRGRGSSGQRRVLEDAKRRGLLIRCIDARFEKGAIVKERKG